MNAQDTLVRPKGHWKFEVYDGDVERAPLTAEERLDNLVVAGFGSILPMHAGKIISKPIDSYEGDNLITTNGKGLILDRLFALGTPPGAITAMGVGNSAVAAAVGDTQLAGATPAPDLRLFDALPTRSGLVVTAVRTYATTEGNMNWQEIGLFNGTVNGTAILFNRIAPIGPFNKTSAVSIVSTVTITQS